MRKGAESDRTHIVSDFPGAAQTVVMLARPFIDAKDTNVTKARVLNAVFSGMFTSRLNMNLREDKHWTYGTSSYFYRING